jgi:hypothetical protein
MSQDFIKHLHHSKIKELLTVISLHYPELFKAENISDELKYLEQHISYYSKYITSSAPSTSQPINQNLNKKQNHSKLLRKLQCKARVYNPIINKINGQIVDKIPSKYKVINFNDIDCNAFNKKYSLGTQCLNKCANIQDSIYCTLHTKHLIHGDFTTSPDGELIFHFIKENKLL